jgi:hypothetical protein
MKLWLGLLVMALTTTAACGRPAQGPVGTSDAAPKAEIRDATPEPFDHWTQLGERLLDADGRHGSIRVNAQESAYFSVRFVLKFGKLEISRVVITFQDGTKWTSVTPMPFGKGVTSRAIDLPGEKRLIQEISFDYSNVASGRSSQLEIWAQ